MNCPIRESEIVEAIEKLSWIKAPGPDEIGSEFDKLFSNAFFPTLVRVFENIRKRKPFPPSMRESHTVLIVADVTESRPISLVCSNYKILVKSLSRRLGIGLQSVIGPHQNYGLRGRSIARNVHVMCLPGNRGGSSASCHPATRPAASFRPCVPRFPVSGTGSPLLPWHQHAPPGQRRKTTPITVAKSVLLGCLSRLSFSYCSWSRGAARSADIIKSRF